MSLPVIAASVFLLFQVSKGSIEGLVVSSTTNKPIAGAQVSVTRMPTPPTPNGGTVQVPSFIVSGVIGSSGAGITENSAPGQLPPVTADNNGRFIFQDLEPGAYLLRASADGYARQEYNFRPGTVSRTIVQVNLSAGEAAKDTVLRLVPGGTVSGRVTGSNGEPLVNIEVSLLRPMYDAEGRKTMSQAGMTQTNDRGEYRLFWMTPGHYYLSAASSTHPIPGFPFNPSNVTNKYPRTFYPSSTDLATPSPIDIQPDAEMSGMDFRLSEQPTYRIRGRIVDSLTGRPVPRGVSIGISPRDPVVNAGSLFSSSPYDPADGAFELRDVPSGSYVIRVQLPLTERPQPGKPFRPPPVAFAPVDVRGADVDGIVVSFLPPVSISGRIRMEEESPVADAARMYVALRAVEPGSGILPPPAERAPDGTFKFDGILPGEYRLTTGGVADLYVKEMRFGPTDILMHPLVISGPTSDMIDIVLGKDGGQITGTVRGDSQQILSGMPVVLVPDRRDRHNIYKYIFTDASGHFTFRAVPPGSYKVFAWRDIEPNSWFDPDVLRSYEQYGTPANVAQSAKLTLDVNLISR